MSKTLYRLLVLPLLFSSHVALANNAEELIRPIQSQWAEIKYRQAEKNQAELFHALAQDARQLAEKHAALAEVMIWEAIALSSEAGAKGGLGALSLAKEAKSRLESALHINDRALQGSAYTSLATLYAKVPGWPLGFGDKAQAEVFFKKALAQNPDGIDPNYLYGEFLLDNGRPNEAKKHLDKALKAAPRPGRELADHGRRQETQALINKLALENR
jgi:hypothetical protein